MSYQFNKPFTIKSRLGVLREIITQIGVSEPFVGPTDASAQFTQTNISSNDPRIFSTNALWDTGATNCVLTKSTAQALNLKPISKVTVNHAKGSSLENVYLVNLYLPNGLVIPGVQVSECEDGQFGVIIGMDIITMGDFSITNVGGITTVSFRIPSLETVDYVHEENQKILSSVGRNDPCPCGSGKKFKQCHGK